MKPLPCSLAPQPQPLGPLRMGHGPCEHWEPQGQPQATVQDCTKAEARGRGGRLQEDVTGTESAESSDSSRVDVGSQEVSRRPAGY